MTAEDLKNILLSKNNKELTEIIKENFIINEDGITSKLITNKKLVNALESDVKVLGIARMNAIIEGFNSTVKMSFIFTLFTGFVTAYRDLLIQIAGSMVANWIAVIFIAVLIFNLVKSLKIDKDRMLLAVYFKTLLENSEGKDRAESML